MINIDDKRVTLVKTYKTIDQVLSDLSNTAYPFPVSSGPHLTSAYLVNYYHLCYPFDQFLSNTCKRLPAYNRHNKLVFFHVPKSVSVNCCTYLVCVQTSYGIWVDQTVLTRVYSKLWVAKFFQCP